VNAGRRTTVKSPTPRRRLPPKYARMLRLTLGAGFVVALGLGHIHLRLATRDMQIQSTSLQAEWTQLFDQKNALAADLSRLTGGGRMLEYAQAKLDLIALPAEQIVVWELPENVMQRYDVVYTQVALARSGATERPDGREPLMTRLLGTVLSPEAQARPAPGRR